MRNFLKKWSHVFLLLLALSPAAWAFPENIRYGYPNCATCHVSPNGGGVMTQYGRQMSGEIQSTWHRSWETRWFYLVDQPDWLALGGDFRFLRVSSGFKQAPNTYQTIMMQADLEAAFIINNKFVIGGTIGRLDSAIYQNQSDWLSRRHWIEYRPTDELYLRFGKYLRPFGINVPDHEIGTKEGLDWDQGTESYLLQASQIAETYNLIGAMDFGRIDQPQLDRDMAVMTNDSLIFGSSYKVGMGYYYGWSNVRHRHVFGPWAQLALSEKWVFLGELDFQNLSMNNSVTGSQWGVFDYVKLDYLLFRGFHIFATQDIQRSNFSLISTLENTLAGGLQWFPRPHFEFNFQYQNKITGITNGLDHTVFLMMHFYP